MEYVDILDEQGRHKGISLSKTEAHKKGKLHPTVHIWLYTEFGEVLIQKRAINKRTFPGLWDVSVAGHLMAGETAIAGAIREIKEEIGLEIDDFDLTKIGVFKNKTVHSNHIIDYEMQHVFLCQLNEPIDALQIQKEEVQKIDLIDLETFKKRAKNTQASLFVPNKTYYYSFVITSIQEAINNLEK